MSDLTKLRFVTYLSPGIPEELFRAVVDRLGARLGVDVELRVEVASSGPLSLEEDPFSRDTADFGWICSPSYIWLRDGSPPPVRLVPCAPVFRDARNEGRPRFFSEVIVAQRSPILSFRALEGRRWVYNDVCSLSGYYSVLHKLASIGANGDFFGEVHRSGGHLASIDLVRTGKIDGAAIDSNVLSIAVAARPELREGIRVIESWGPFPIQPLVARSDVPRSVTDAVSEILSTIHEDGALNDMLKRLGVTRFASISDEDFDQERRAMKECSGLTLAPGPPR